MHQSRSLAALDTHNRKTQMKKDVLQLDGEWEFKEFPESARRMRDLDQGGWMQAPVPSSIYTCLAHAGFITETELHANPENFHWISQRSWIFRKQFDLRPSFQKNDRIRLIFEGLDTVAHVWCNGKLLGKTENMFTPHVFDVTDYVKPAGNTIYVKFLPALRHAERLMQRYGRLSEHHFGDPRRCYLRKAQYQFGSAMGPAMVGCGIFRNVRLESIQTAQLSDVHVRTVDCNQYDADVRVAVTLDRIQNTQTALMCRLTLTGGGLDRTEELEFTPQQDQHAMLLHIERPILWWPRGYGVPHQYHLKVELYRENELLDVTETDFGIRTIRLNRTADPQGCTFEFEVNGQPIYAKGANWMPLSLFSNAQTESDYAGILKQAAGAHFNMLRVWGGGIYEHPEFYRQCDRLGILVWQDFMFATAYYPDRKWFSDIIHEEARSVITQLRNHPSLALWCGNSRIDSLHEAGRLGKGRKFFGKAIYHELLPGLLSELDPDRDYIPTTPFSESEEKNHNEPASGTTHNWKVWNNFAGEEEYEMPTPKIPRFVTEFGLQSAPDMQTISTFSLNNEVPIGSASLKKHNYQPSGPARIARYTTEHFSPPTELKDYIRQSQLVQARAIKRLVEHLRSHREMNAGCLFWTLNDSLPSVNFAAIDAFGRPKALYYYAKRFYAPIIAILMQSEDRTTYQARVINDSTKRITATLRCRMVQFDGAILDETNIPIAISPMNLSTPCPLPKSFLALHRCPTAFLHLSLNSESETLAENCYFFVPDKHLRCGAGTITIEIVPQDDTGHIWSLRLCAERLFRDIQLVLPQPGRLSDNFFHLLPNCPIEITAEFDQPIHLPKTPIDILSNHTT